MESILERQSKNNEEYLEVNTDTLKAVKYLLRSSMNICKAADARLIVINPNQKQRIIGFSDDPLSDLDRILIENVSIQQKILIYEKEEKLSLNSASPVTLQGKKSINTDHAYLLCPLISRHQTIGVLILKEKLYAPGFSNEDKILLNSLTSYFIRIWETASLKKNDHTILLRFSECFLLLTEKIELERENLDAKELIGEIIRVSKLINSTLDLHALLESIMESAKLVLKSEGSSLMLIDETTNELYFNIVTGEKEQELKQVRIPVGTGIAGMVAQSMQPLIVNDAQNDTRLFKAADLKAGFTTRNLIACPLMVRDKIIGVLEVINAIGRPNFSKDDLDLFYTFSEQAAIAIHNRELIKSLQETNTELSKKVHELSSLHEVSKVLISGINERELFDAVIKIIAEVLNAKSASLMLFREKTNSLELVSQTGLKLPESKKEGGVNINTDSMENTISGFSFKENQVFLSKDLRDKKYAKLRKNDNYLSDTCIVYPLSSGNNRYGIINISDKDSGKDFNEEDLQLLSIIASQVIKAIENFQLLSQMIEKKSFEKELEITSSIQKSILPTKAVTSPHFNLGFISKPAKIMGGDFYGFDTFSNGDFSFLIADVSGKSLPAALFMAITHSIIKTLIQDYQSPGELMKRTNDLVYKNSHSGMFVTLFYLYLDTSERLIRFASAGHNEQFIYRARTDEFIFLEAKGRPLGIINTQTHGPFIENSIAYEKNDLVVLYTDGIVEAINEDKEEFGIDRFKALIKRLGNNEPQEIADEVFREIEKFAGNEPQFDDFTLLIFKMNIKKK